jgi:hypothetical protein
MITFVFVEVSITFGFAWSANAWSAPARSFFLAESISSSSGDAWTDNVGESGATNDRCTYLVVMNFKRASLEDCIFGRCVASAFASHTEFDIRLPI